MTALDLQHKLHDHPFQPLRIRMSNNTTYDILEPWMILIGESSAIIVTRMRKDDRGYETVLEWRTISISHILEYSNLESGQPNRAASAS